MALILIRLYQTFFVSMRPKINNSNGITLIDIFVHVYQHHHVFKNTYVNKREGATFPHFCIFMYLSRLNMGPFIKDVFIFEIFDPPPPSFVINSHRHNHFDSWSFFLYYWKSMGLTSFSLREIFGKHKIGSNRQVAKKKNCIFRHFL